MSGFKGSFVKKEKMATNSPTFKAFIMSYHSYHLCLPYTFLIYEENLFSHTPQQEATVFKMTSFKC